MKIETLELEKVLNEPGGAEWVVEKSVALATGAMWLEDADNRSTPITYLAEPADEWGRTVDAIELPFASVYDKEEYANPALKMLNVAEFAMLARAFDPPTMEEYLRDCVGLPRIVKTRGLRTAEVLDVGCGTGRIALFLTSLGATVTAVDQTAKYVEITAGKMNRLPIDIIEPNLVVAPIESILDDKQKFDFVTSMFAVLNHCQDWRSVLRGLTKVMRRPGTLAMSMYGSPEATVFKQIETGLPYEPAILVRRVQNGILLGESDEVLPARFPYPREVLDCIEDEGLDVLEVTPFLLVTSLYPRDPKPENICSFLNTIKDVFGEHVSSYLKEFAANPEQLLVASLAVDYEIATQRDEALNEAAYYGIIAIKRESGN